MNSIAETLQVCPDIFPSLKDENGLGYSLGILSALILPIFSSISGSSPLTTTFSFTFSFYQPFLQVPRSIWCCLWSPLPYPLCPFLRSQLFTLWGWIWFIRQQTVRMHSNTVLIMSFRILLLIRARNALIGKDINIIKITTKTKVSGALLREIPAKELS